jgi:cytochrome c
MRLSTYLKNRSIWLKWFDGILAASALALAFCYASAVYIKFFVKEEAVRVKEQKIAEGAVLFDQQNCRTCHGSPNEGTLNSSYPKIFGQNATYLIAQLKDFKSGARTNGMSSVMQDAAGSLSEEDFEKIALYLEANIQ